MTRVLTSAQLSDQSMPSVLQNSFGNDFKMTVAQSEAVQQHWAVMRLYKWLYRLDLRWKYTALQRAGEYDTTGL